ncbi:hypothetical protein scyTo_0017083 [Scyliorhinus torazame]|uniref:Uncharacterized protein n=1 Tax=Scyliorhinus torazame TaxID=75743 RepID=A0A401Q404_SCYTO|nr:hypothetical protein [Scyliorhinus torazame]
MHCRIGCSKVGLPQVALPGESGERPAVRPDTAGRSRVSAAVAGEAVAEQELQYGVKFEAKQSADGEGQKQKWLRIAWCCPSYCGAPKLQHIVFQRYW